MSASGFVDLVPKHLRQAWVEQGIYPNCSVYARFKQQVLAHPHRMAVLDPHGGISYQALWRKAMSMANYLHACGIVAGDVVAYQLSNSWKCCAIDLAVAALGAIVLPFPPGRGRLDMEAMLKRSSARALIVEPVCGQVDVCDLVEAIRPHVLSLRVLCVDGAPPADWHALEACWTTEPIDEDVLPAVCADEPARLLVSSGTESEPKLVAYSHNALLGGRGQFIKRLQSENALFRGLYLVPLGSAFGSTATVGVLCCLGGTVLLLPQFEAKAAIQAIETMRPTHVLGVPTMIQRMMAEDALGTVDKSSLVALVSGGAVVDPSTIVRSQEAFACRFISLYGSADGMNCHNTLQDDQETLLHTVGRPNPSVCDIRIVNDQGETLPQGEVGEIVARGPISPMQYVNAPELDAMYRDAEGWVRSGDLGFLDAQGRLVLAGRKKDIIIRGGANISTSQIEQLAMMYPNVVSAACVPVPDADLGQRVCLCLTLKEGVKRPSLLDLNQHFQQQGLEKNKWPEYLRLMRELPISPAGKVDKKRLTEDLVFLGSTP
jgi:acyl-CoA synthetase